MSVTKKDEEDWEKGKKEWLKACEKKGYKKEYIMSDFWKGILIAVIIVVLGYFGMLFYFMSL